MQDEYHALSYKTMALWRLAEDHFDIDYLIKVDDDNFVRLDRLSIATHQWDEENAGPQSSLLWRHPPLKCAGFQTSKFLRWCSGGSLTSSPSRTSRGRVKGRQQMCMLKLQEIALTCLGCCIMQSSMHAECPFSNSNT